MEKNVSSTNDTQKIKLILLDIFPSVEELEKAKKDLIIIFQGVNNFYNLIELITKKKEVILETNLSSVIMSLIEYDNLLSTSVFTIKQGEHWVKFSYENQKKTNNLALTLINCVKIKFYCDIIIPQNIINQNNSTTKLDLIKNKKNQDNYNKKFQKNTSKSNFKNDISSKNINNHSLLNEKPLFLIDIKKLNKGSFKKFKAGGRSPKEKTHSITDSVLGTLRPVSNRITNTEHSVINNNNSNKHIRALSGNKKSEIVENSVMKRFNTNHYFHPANSINKGNNNDYNDKENLLKIIKNHKIIIEQYDLNKNKKNNKLSNDQLDKRNSKIDKSNDTVSKDENNKNNSNLQISLRNKYKNKYKTEDMKKSLTKNTVNYFYSTLNRKKDNNNSLNNSINKPNDRKSFTIKMDKESPRDYFNKKNNLIGAITSRRNYLLKKSPYLHKQNFLGRSIENYYNIKNSKNFTNNSSSSENDNTDDYENDISKEDIGINFLKLKKDFISMYNEKYLKNIKEDLLKLEIELLVEKMNALISEYHSQMDDFIIENKLLMSDLKQNSENYLMTNKLLSKLFVIKKECKTKIMKIKKYENNVGKNINKNINIHKDEFELFEILLNKKENKKKYNEKDKETIKNIIDILINKNNNRDLIVNENKRYKNWIELNFKSSEKKISKRNFKNRVKITLQTDGIRKVYNKINLNEDVIEEKKHKYKNLHTDDDKRDMDSAYIKKTPITPIYSRKFNVRKSYKNKMK